MSPQFQIHLFCNGRKLFYLLSCENSDSNSVQNENVCLRDTLAADTQFFDVAE